jgi:serine protease Do
LKEDEKCIKDVEWKEVECKGENLAGEIKFRNKSKNLSFIGISKGIVFILIATFSGAISGSYIANKKYSELKTQRNNTSVFQGNKISNNYTSKPENSSQNSIAMVAESVSQSVIEIIDKDSNDEQLSSTSGIIFKSDGYIVTNYHVLQDANKYSVKLSSKTLPAKIIGYDLLTDLAVLKINAKNLPAATFGDSSKVQLGDCVVAVGNPDGNTTTGIVSSTNKKIRNQNDLIGSDTTYDVIQTDAIINQGNSGGALCNLNGEVIGINSLGVNPRNKGDGVSFAISTNEARSIINSIIKSGHVVRPYLGIQTEDYESDDKTQTKGVIVKAIIKDTKAEKSGIEVNDIIVEFDGVNLYSTDELEEILEKHKANDSIPLKVMRNGKLIKCSVVLSERPDN